MIEKIIEQGGLFAILALLVFLMARVLMWVARRLFAPVNTTKGEAGGLLVQYFESNKEFMKGLEQRDKTQLEVARQHALTLESLGLRVEEGGLQRLDLKDSIEGLINCVDDPNGGATAPFNDSMVDIAKAHILELSITSAMSDLEKEQVRIRIESLFKSIQQRHMNIMDNVQSTEKTA